eukprot:1216708-Amorphochlora_amoeboformis.AAC.1
MVQPVERAVGLIPRGLWNFLRILKISLSVPRRFPVIFLLPFSDLYHPETLGKAGVVVVIGLGEFRWTGADGVVFELEDCIAGRGIRGVAHEFTSEWENGRRVVGVRGLGFDARDVRGTEFGVGT